jgi:hypothetical protein
VPSSPVLVPDFLRAIVDDAADFPPANASLDDAVRDHAGHRTAAYAELVGPFVIADSHLPRLAEIVTAAAPDEPLGVSVVVGGGAGALEPAVRWATRSGSLELRSVEIAMRESDAGDLAPNAHRIVLAVDRLVDSGVLDEDVPVYVEPPRLHEAEPSTSWWGALDEVAAMGHRLKLRTGGVDSDAFPSTRELATCIGAALDRELPFKCTAGLHHAVRHRDTTTGFEHHGFLNVLLATRASLDGDGPAEVADVLEDRDAGASTTATEADALSSARRWFTSFGSCSVLDPVHDLSELGLMPDRGSAERNR